MKQLAILFIVATMAFSCQRKGEPLPKICAENGTTVNTITTIKITDTLALSNCSERSNTQRWKMPDGGTSTLEKVYFIPTSLDTVEVHLFVSNSKFVNEYEAVQTVVVVP